MSFLRGALVAGVVLGAVGVVAAASAAAVAVYFARRIVTPPRRPAEDQAIVSADSSTVLLTRSPDSQVPGRYSLFFDDTRGHARIGAIVEHTQSTVRREVITVDRGNLSLARRGRISGWFYLGPEEFGLPWSDVDIPTDLGPAPAWLIPAPDESTRWAIHVHGRAVRREETLRSVPTFHNAGYSSLLISYRNDGDAPRSPDHRYGLGTTEWRDVDAAIRFALARGAREIVLVGWSMGGATVLQTLTRSTLASFITGIVLDSPVIDWVTTLQFQGIENRLPPLVRAGAIGLLRETWGGVLTGQAQPLDLHGLDLVARADELTSPILLFHSEDDGYVPVTASDALAEARPDIVTYERFSVARHTKLWNYDAPRWEGAISRWLNDLA
ncbi:alpha/beta fold hydrolase [Antiquaquibacter oligotrophicus]|uniref:alpha/beta hydrolase family protein n=1 Tax=Antiquaquibacter oligotrophicus TaxID=2880260 RepID=UPI002AC930A9|nr:alpha/beta fold hydrolase [Antiquaquibacter oligotrophicus]UDF13276.1 alpha/beta fold hydrolase [Antiquaquibacter oligotrophicus]